MRRLIGKRVWVMQEGDLENNHLLMWCCDVSYGFVALAMGPGEEPCLYVNLAGVSQIEVYPEDKQPNEPGIGILLVIAALGKKGRSSPQ